MEAPTASAIRACSKPPCSGRKTGYYADLIEEAATLWESMSQNHPFADGYKRTAFAATYTFLGINGVRLTADAQETYDFVAGLYEKNQFNFEQLVPWLREHVEPASATVLSATFLGCPAIAQVHAQGRNPPKTPPTFAAFRVPTPLPARKQRAEVATRVPNWEQQLPEVLRNLCSSTTI